MIDRFSLRWRVPVIIALILIGAVITLTAMAYGAARRSALEVANERLQHAVSQVAEVGAAGTASLKRNTARVADDSFVIGSLRRPDAPLSEGALVALRRLRPDTNAPVAVAALDAQGRALDGLTPELAREEPAESFAPAESTTVSPFRTVDGLLEYTVVAPVRDSGRVIGQIVQWRRVPRVISSIRIIGNLIGDSAVLLIGNSDGSVVVELQDSTRAPVVRDAHQTRQAGSENISVAAPIQGTPWSFFLEYPHARILAPLRLLSWQSVLVALCVLGLAVLSGVIMSRGMTTPLADLSRTAEYIAAGDLSRRPHETTRRDEIGRLARSFGVMADRVSESRDLLERRISDRTSDLQAAMEQLRETQDELVRKERLATIGQLASSVGHELRNPLGVMSNSVYLLEHTVDATSPKAKEYLRMLRTQIKLSERIVSDLLDSARNPAPQRKLVEVRPFLLEQVERVNVPPNVQLDMGIDDSLPPMYVDSDQVGQILVNLLTNGAQSMGQKNGTLSVRARNGAGRIRIDVRDTGPGVPTELADKIFEPLFTTKARGIGLGLSVSRSLALANQGSLSVANHAEGGAVFTLELPAGKAS